jgi:hypothetical protein
MTNRRVGALGVVRVTGAESRLSHRKGRLPLRLASSGKRPVVTHFSVNAVVTPRCANTVRGKSKPCAWGTRSRPKPVSVPKPFPSIPRDR